MSGSKSTNNQAVQFQQQQASEADAKEAARQAQLTQGTNVINSIFDGQPVMANQTTNFDWSNYNPGSSPGGAGHSLFASTQTPTTAPSATGLPAGYTAVAGGITGPDGTFHPQGSAFSYTSQVPTGQTTGGFDDAYYNNYRNADIALQQPEEQRQYDESRRDLTYNLARQGILNSSAAADKTGELAYQDSLQKANIFSNADAATAALRQNVDTQKQSILNQLYATNDPTTAAELAQSSAKGLQLQAPTLTPGVQLFDPALSAVGSYIAGQTSPYNTATPYQQSTGPTPAPANKSSGSYTL